MAIDSGAWIFGATAIAYLCAYLFERGALGHFGVPPEFIEVSVMCLVSTGGAFLVFSVLLLQFWSSALQLDEMVDFGRFKGLGRLLAKWWIFFLMWGIGFLFFSYNWTTLLVFSVWFLNFLMDVLIPLIPKEDGVNYDERLYAWLNKPQGKANIDPSRKSFLKGKVASVFAVIGVVSLLCLFSGQIAAAARTNYASLDSEKGYLVLRHYGSKYLLVRYDSVSRIFAREYKIVREEDVNGNIHVVNVGWRSKVSEPDKQ